MSKKLEKATFVIEGTGDYEGSVLRMEVTHPKSPHEQKSEIIKKEVLTPDGSFFGQELTFENVLTRLKEALINEGMYNLPDSLKDTEVSITWKVK